jgi:hypothetical protein
VDEVQLLEFFGAGDMGGKEGVEERFVVGTPPGSVLAACGL